MINPANTCLAVYTWALSGVAIGEVLEEQADKVKTDAMVSKIQNIFFMRLPHLLTVWL